MGIKDTFKIKEITKKQAEPWILKKHYAERFPVVSFYFGLFEKNKLVGVATLGNPSSRNEHKKGTWFNMLELNRLVSADNLPKNALSYFVSKILKKLPIPAAVVSYADANNGHHGYIYQATNWIYNGKIKKDGHPIIFFDGEQVHPRTMYSKYGTSSIKKLKNRFEDRIETKKKKRKFKYYYLLGTKGQQKKMKKELNIKEKEYPKGDNKKHNKDIKIN